MILYNKCDELASARRNGEPLHDGLRQPDARLGVVRDALGLPDVVQEKG